VETVLWFVLASVGPIVTVVLAAKVAVMDTSGAGWAAEGFCSCTLKERYDTPFPTAYAKTFAAVTLTVRVPVAWFHLPARVEEDVAATEVTGMLDVDSEVLPVRPLTVSTGLHEAINGTFKVRETVIVFVSHGYGELCVTPHMLLSL